AADGTERGTDIGMAFRLEYTRLTKIQRALPRDGFDDCPNVGRGGRKACRHVERYAARIAYAGTDSRIARQKRHPDAPGRFAVSSRPRPRADRTGSSRPSGAI